MAFPELRGCLANCFHEDWAHDFPDAAAAIRWYLGIAFPEQLDRARAELGALLACGFSEDELERILIWDLGCSYDPTTDGLTRRDWLRSVQALLG